MTDADLRLAALWAIPAFWLAAIVLHLFARHQRRRAFRIVGRDLTFYGYFGAAGSTYCFLMMQLPDSGEDNGLATLLALGLFFPLIAPVVYYFPSAVLPVDLIERWRFGRPALSLRDLPKSGDDDVGTRIAHLTDLHLTSDRTLEGDLPADRVAVTVTETLRWASQNSDAVFLTGDLTDQGSSSEWDSLLEGLRSAGCSLDSGRVFLVPGNHDLALVTEQRPGGAPSTIAFEERAFPFITKVLAQCPPEWTMKLPTGPVGVREYLRRVADYLEAYRDNPPFARSVPAGGGGVVEVFYPHPLLDAADKYPDLPWPSRRSLMLRDFLQLAYPMVMGVKDGKTIVGLNSCDRAPQTLLDSGMGRLGKAQIESFVALAAEAAAESRQLLVLVHHHVAFPNELLEELKKRRSRVQIRALALRDGYRLAQALSTIDGCVVFHGHKHLGYRAGLGGATIVSGPSVVYGSEFGGANGSVYRLCEGQLRIQADSPVAPTARDDVSANRR